MKKIIALIAALALLLTVIIAAILLFASAGAAVWLSQFIGLTQSLFAIAGTYLLLLLIIYGSRKSWIERPLVKYLSRLLLN